MICQLQVENDFLLTEIAESRFKSEDSEIVGELLDKIRNLEVTIGSLKTQNKNYLEMIQILELEESENKISSKDTKY
jgi:hypothetical protein